MAIEVGSLVRSPKMQEKGVGKVVAAERGYLFVFFPRAPGSKALRLSPTADLEEVESHSDLWLDNLPAFEKRGLDFYLPEGRLTQQEAIAKFRRIFPKGFKDPDYYASERSYKEAARDQWQKTLGNNEARSMLDANDLDEVISRALRVEGTLNLLSTFEKAALRDGLKSDPVQARSFFEAVLAFASGPAAGTEGSFARLVAAVSELPADRSRVLTWPVVTIFPFCADPEQHIFVKPEVTKEASRRMGFELHYDSVPNWRTYSAVLKLARHLRDQLRVDGALDFIDAQSFIWVVSRYDDPLGASPSPERK